MKTIWKFPLEIADEVTIEMPENAQLLSVQTQRDQPVLWALVDPDMPRKPCRLRIVGTGHPITGHPGQFFGTFQLFGGDLVFHVFLSR